MRVGLAGEDFGMDSTGMGPVYETTLGLAFGAYNMHKAGMKIGQFPTNVCAAAIVAAALTTVGCNGSRPLETATRTLTTTYWKLTSLGDTPVTIYEEREPYMELQADPARVAGSDGCNRMMGSYTLNGEKIEFSKMAGTMMACANGMEQGAAFTRALSLTASWRVDGSTLTLFDTDAKKLLTFEASARKSP
jgi:heat shock protein HslJ